MRTPSTSVLLRRVAIPALVTVAAALAAAPARAVRGDLAPRGAPDGLLDIRDAELAWRMAKGVLAPTQQEVDSADVFPGVLSNAQAPPTWTPTGNGQLTTEDAATILGVVLGAQVFPDTVSILLSSANTTAYVGVAWSNVAHVSMPLQGPTVFSLLAGAPAGMSIDPASGVIAYTPAPGDAGLRSFTVKASDGQKDVATGFQVTVIAPTLEASKFDAIGTEGAHLEANPAGPLAGTTFDVPPGKFEGTTDLLLQDVPDAPEMPGAMPLGDGILPPQGKPFTGDVTLSATFDPGDLPPGASGKGVLMGYYSTAPADSTLDRPSSLPQWLPIPATVDLQGGRVTGLLQGRIDGIIRLFFHGEAPQTCPVDNADQRFVFVQTTTCPDYDLDHARAYFETALFSLQGGGMQFQRPITAQDPISVVILPLDTLSHVSFNLPRTVFLSDHLLIDGDRPEDYLASTAAHAMAHVAQYDLLGNGHPFGVEGPTVNYLTHFDFPDNAFVLEGAAAAFESLVVPSDVYLRKGNRIAADYPALPIDEFDRRYQQYELFDYLVTNGLLPSFSALYTGDRSGYSEPGGGILALDSLLYAQLPFGLSDAYLDLVSQHDVLRDDAHLAGVSTWPLTAPEYLPLGAGSTAANPLILVEPQGLRHMSGRTGYFQLDTGLDPNLHVFVGAFGSAPLYSRLFNRVQTGVDENGQPLFAGWGFSNFNHDNVVFDVADLFDGGTTGQFAVVSTNPEFADDGAGSMELAAWVGVPVQVAITQPDGTSVCQVQGDFGSPCFETTAGHVFVGGVVTNGAMLGVDHVVVRTTGGATLDAGVTGDAFGPVYVPLAFGGNDLLVIASGTGATGLPLSGSARVHLESTMQAPLMQVTLTWDTDASDVDLYVRQPNAEDLWYDNKTSIDGDSRIDVDDTDGFGPEVYTLTLPQLDEAHAGEYTIGVHYYADHSGATTRPVAWHLDVVTFPGTDKETRSSYDGVISTADSSADTPGTTGASWSGNSSVTLQ